MIDQVGKPVIAVDIDDTIAASTESLRLLVNERIGANLAPETYQIPGEYWGYYERVWEAHGLADQISYQDFEHEMVTDQTRVPLLPGALFAIKELSAKYQIVLITARDSSWEAATQRWIDSHLDDLGVDLYFCANHKDAKAKTKGQICADLGATVLIDDNVVHCQSTLDQGVRAILFGRYGWQMNIPDGMEQCSDWQAVLEALDGGK